MELHSRALIMQRVHRVLWIKVSRDMTDRRASPFVNHSRTWSRQPSIIVFSAAKVENERVMERGDGFLLENYYYFVINSRTDLEQN